MSNNLLDGIPSFDRVSIRAVVVCGDEDPTQALSEAGIFNPVALPLVLGEDQPDISFGDGITPNLIAILEPDQEDEGSSEAPFRGDGLQSLDNDSRRLPEISQAQPGTASLPAAFGMQPLAPVRPRGSLGSV